MDNPCANFFTGLAILLMAVCTLPGQAQPLISTTSYLSEAYSDPALKSWEKEVSFLKNTSHVLPLGDELEFRTETDEFDFYRQEYLLRLSFNGLKARKQQQKLHQSHINYLESEQAILLQEALAERYNNLLSIYYLQKKRFLRNQQLAVIKDKIKVIRILAEETEDFDIKDLIAAEDRLHELEQIILDLSGQAALLGSKSALPVKTDGSVSLDTSGFLTVAIIRERLTALTLQPVQHPELLHRQLKIDRTRSEYAYEEAKTQRILDFAQFRYAGRDRLPFGREWTIGLGFEIPMKGEDKLELNELMLQRIEDENRLEFAQLKLVEKIQELRAELNLKMDQYDLASRQLQESQSRHAYDRYATFKDANPLLLLQMKESLLKREVSLVEIENSIFQRYTELLELTGEMVRLPLKNYLLKEPEQF